MIKRLPSRILMKKNRQLSSEYEKLSREISNIIENKVREKFNHKKVGEAWINETILFLIIQNIYPEKTIFKHYRPKCLEGLELDIYVQENNLGIEYQGIQHYKPVKHWGGEQSLQKLKARDQKKRELCEKLGIKLVYFEFDEEISESFVRAKLSQLI